MTTPIRLFLLAALSLSALFASNPAYALRCDGKIVDEGDRDLRVLRVCGQPFYRESWYEAWIEGAWSMLETREAVRWEEWYYNFGPNRLMRRLVFRAGVLVDEQELGYGFARIEGRCARASLLPGLTPGEIVARCGEPLQKERRLLEQVRRDGMGQEHWRPLREEQWVYDFGGRWLYTAIFLDGRLDHIRRDER